MDYLNTHFAESLAADQDSLLDPNNWRVRLNKMLNDMSVFASVSFVTVQSL